MSGQRRGWQEVGDRVYRFRYRSLDLNVGAVVGDDEVLVVDTRSLPAEAARLLADLRALTRPPCRQVVNTHAHFDHCFGNATLRPAAIWGHARCAAHLRTRAAQERAHLLRWLPEAAADLEDLELDPPDRTVGDAGADLQVGGRRVELRFCGRGHTDHDLVVVVPGHGDLVGHRFIAAQREELAAMAALCRRVAAGELAAEQAVGAAPFPEGVARQALALSARAAGPAGGAAPGTARPG